MQVISGPRHQIYSPEKAWLQFVYNSLQKSRECRFIKKHEEPLCLLKLFHLPQNIVTCQKSARVQGKAALMCWQGFKVTLPFDMFIARGLNLWCKIEIKLPWSGGWYLGQDIWCFKNHSFVALYCLKCCAGRFLLDWKKPIVCVLVFFGSIAISDYTESKIMNLGVYH